MATKPVRVPSSIAEPYLLLNIRTSNVGFALVELRNPESGQPIEGFSFKKSDLIRGNTLSAAASWDHGKAGSLVALRDKMVTVAVAMADSDLFSVQFGETTTEVFALKRDDAAARQKRGIAGQSLQPDVNGSVRLKAGDRELDTIARPREMLATQ